VNAVRDAGCTVYHVEVHKDGKIVIVTDGHDHAAAAQERNEWDDEEVGDGKPSA